MIIAVDGPTASGKGTIAKAIAAHFELPYLDTGLLYRAVGAKVLAGADPLDAARALTPEDLETGDLRTQAVAKAASQVAVNPDVRAALVDFQRSFARRLQKHAALTPTELLQSLRISEAIRLARSTRLPQEEIAHRVGYGDATALRRLMRKRGMGTLDSYR